MATCTINSEEFQAIENQIDSATAWKELAIHKVSGEPMRTPLEIIKEGWKNGQFLNKKAGPGWKDTDSGYTQKINSLAQYELFQRPLKFDVKSNNNRASLATLKQLAEKLKNKANVDFQFITENRAIELTSHLPFEQQYVPGKPSFFLNGISYFVSNHVSAKNVLHEFAHPIVRAISVENKKLFNKLYEQVVAQYPEIIEYVKNNYGYLEENSDNFKEEVIVTTLDLLYEIKTNNKKVSSGVTKLLKEILFAIRQTLRKIFSSNIKVEKIKESTTLLELAQMLENDETFDIDMQIVTDADFAAYDNSYHELRESIKEAYTRDGVKTAVLNTYDQMIGNARALTDKKEYAEAKNILVDKYGESQINSLIRTLNSVREKPEDIVKDMVLAEAQTDAFLNAIISTEKMIDEVYASLETLSSDAQKNERGDKDNRDALQNTYYLLKLVDSWEIFIDEHINLLAKTGIRSDNEFFQKLATIKTKIQRTQKISNSIYVIGLADILNEELGPLREAIEYRYKLRIDFLKSKGASESKIKEVENEYNEIKLDPLKMDYLLQGEMGDAHFLNSYLEGYMNNQDPVVMGFANYVKNNLHDVNSKALEKLNKFYTELNPLLEAAGFNPKLLGDLGQRLVQIDTKRVMVDNKPEFKKIYKFINPWVGQDEVVGKMDIAIEAARKTAIDTGDYTEVTKLTLEKEKFMRQYFHTEYTQKYYEKYDLLSKDAIGQEAGGLLREIDLQIRSLERSIMTPLQDIIGENLDQLEELKKQKKALFSLVDENGTFKVGKALKIAERLQEYSKASKGMFEEVSYPTLFEEAYKEAENYFIEEGLTKDGDPNGAFAQAMNKWLRKNTEFKIKPEFYEYRASLYAQIDELVEEYKALMIQLNSSASAVNSSEEMLEAYKEINDILYRYRDESGQPLGKNINEATLKKLKVLEERIDMLRAEQSSLNGLTKLENNWLSKYYTKLSNKDTTPEEDYKAKQLNEKKIKINKKARKKMAASDQDIAEDAEIVLDMIYGIFDELSDLQNKMPTEDYLDVINVLLVSLPENIQLLLDDRGQGAGLTAHGANTLIESAEDDLLATIFAGNDTASVIFKDWFEKNHVSKVRTVQDKSGKWVDEQYYVRLKAWTIITPSDKKYIETHTLTDVNGETIELELIPNKKYRSFKLKDKPEDGFVTPKISILEAIKAGDITKANWDGNNWLPNLNAIDSETGQTSTKFLSKEFQRIKNNPAEYALLMKLLEFHFENQKGHNRSDALGFEIPRFIRTDLENIQRRKAIKINNDDDEKQEDNRFQVLVSRIKKFFTRSTEDQEDDMNPHEQSKMMVYTDALEGDVEKIPVRGMYNLELNETSLDILTGLTRYMYSLERKSKLVEMNPIARTLQKVLRDPNNAVKENNKWNKRKFKNQNILTRIGVKGKYVRADAIDNFIEREFEGKVQKGWGSESALLQQLSGSLMKLSSFGYFALNMQSAIKNSMGARMQAMIEGAAGIYYNNRDYAKGTYWSNKTMAEVSFEIYKYGPKSLNIQLLELFDPVQGRLEDSINRGEKTMRTPLSDVVNSPLSLLTNTRKWTELNAQYSIFGALMFSQKVEQTIDGHTRMIPYIEAFELVDGNIQLKEGINKEWAPGGKKYKLVKNRVHAVSNDLNGAFSKFDYAEADRYFLFRQIMFLRRWFTRMLMNRFQVTGGWAPKTWKPRYDVGRNDVYMGYYTQAIRFLVVDLLKQGGKAFTYMSPQEKAAFMRIGMDTAIMIIMQLMIAFIFGFDTDDPDKYKKLRERSGPISILGVADSEYDFHLGGWIANNALVTLMGIRQEQVQWVPLPGVGLTSYMEWLELQPLAMRNTIMNFVKAANQLVNLAEGDDKAYYVRSVGPYEWQQEEAPKIINFAAKMFGVSGSQTDPVKAAKDFVAIQNIKGN